MSINLFGGFKKAALIVMLFSAGAANAGLLNFKITGDYTAEWQLNSKVVPSFVESGYDFYVDAVPGTYSGTSSKLGGIVFFNASLDGGLDIYDYTTGEDLLVTDGPQLYTGPENAPTFLTGTFAMTQYEGKGKYTLTVTDLDAAPPSSNVPEPATGAMLLSGFGLMCAIRKRRQRG